MTNEELAAVTGAVLGAAIALRTTLSLSVVAIRAIDLALDGKVDWLWPEKLARALERADRVLDLLPVKPPVVRSRR